MTEGWEWVLIQKDPCPQCGHDPASLAPEKLGALAVAEAGRWAAFLAKTDQTSLRSYPAGGAWSPMELAAHTRDMLRVFGDRILAALAEDNPTVPTFDHEPAARAEDYNNLPVEFIAQEIRTQAERLAAILVAVPGAGWARTAMRDGVDRFTVRGMACFAVHEAHHHLLDAAGDMRQPS